MDRLKKKSEDKILKNIKFYRVGSYITFLFFVLTFIFFIASKYTMTIIVSFISLIICVALKTWEHQDYLILEIRDIIIKEGK